MHNVARTDHKAELELLPLGAKVVKHGQKWFVETIPNATLCETGWFEDVKEAVHLPIYSGNDAIWQNTTLPRLRR